MNRRSFIKTAAGGVVGLVTGWGLLKPTRKWLPGHVWNHYVQLTVNTFSREQYPDVFRVTHYPVDGQSWEDFFKGKV